MQKTILYSLIALVALSSCAKSPNSSQESSQKKFFEAWIQVHHPNAQKTKLGSYIISETVGSGELASDSKTTPYVKMNYVIRSLDGNIEASNLESIEKQLGLYDKQTFYGPEVWTRKNNALKVGLDEAIVGMRVGGKRTVVIPSWLNSYERLAEGTDYPSSGSNSNHLIYELELKEIITDIKKWETDSIARYLAHNFPSVQPKDSIEYGFYTIKTYDDGDNYFPSSEKKVYVNYVGRLLNGKVFDTNIADSAKVHNIYKSGTKYEPTVVTWPVEDSEDYTFSGLKLGSGSDASSMIDGFAKALWKMKKNDCVTAIFYSSYGYGVQGSSPYIPAYSPLRFDLELIVTTD